MLSPHPFVGQLAERMYHTACWGFKSLRLNSTLKMESSRPVTLQMKKMRPRKGRDLDNVAQPVALETCIQGPSRLLRALPRQPNAAHRHAAFCLARLSCQGQGEEQTAIFSY